MLAIIIQFKRDHELEVIAYMPCESKAAILDMEQEVFAGKKYKPVDQKIIPIKGTLDNQRHQR